VDVRTLDEKSSHVQIATDFSQQRGTAARQSAVTGGIIGTALGGLAAGLIAISSDPSFATYAGEVAAFVAVAGGTITGAVRLAGRQFKRRMLEAKLELDGLLDRAEHSERLEPPPAPWRRLLQQRLRGG
jgi:predicted lipid-binding transport protein (Tim44 family)